METSEVYGRLAANVLAGNPEAQRSATGLFLTVGVADRYHKGDISEDEAREQMRTIIDTGQVPDAIAVKALNDALQNSNTLGQTPFDGILFGALDQGFKGFGVVAAPVFSSPAGAITVGAVAAFGAPLVKYLEDPDNILSGQFAPPRPDSVLLAGSVAMEQIDRITRQNEQLAQIYRDTVPQSALPLKIGDPNSAEALAGALPGELAEPIQQLLRADAASQRAALSALEGRLYKRLDGLDSTTKDMLSFLKEEKDERERQKKINEAQQQEQYIHQEIAGGITLIGAFAHYVLRDQDLEKQVTGCLQAAQTVQKLFSSFVGGSLGPLGLAGGVFDTVKSLCGIFGGGPDAVVQKLDVIDKKLDRMTKILIEGFQQLDRRLSDVLTLAHLTLNEVVEKKRIDEEQFNKLNTKLDYLTNITVSAARAQFEGPLTEMARAIHSKIIGGESVENEVGDYLSKLVAHARDHSRRPEMNGALPDGSPAALSDSLERIADIRTTIGNLQHAVNLAAGNITLVDQNPPDVKHWSRAVQGILELLTMVPTANLAEASDHLQSLWTDGNALKASVLSATNPDLFVKLLDQYEATSLRERSNAAVVRTLDEQVDEILGNPIGLGESLPKHLENLVSLLDSENLNIGTGFRYLLSVLSWRLSNVGDPLNTNPRAVELISDKRTLTQYLIEVLACEAAPEGSSGGGSLTETRENQTYFRTVVRETIMKGLRAHIATDIDRLRSSLPQIAKCRRVRDVDEALFGINALARSRGVSLEDVKTPLLRIPASKQPNSALEIENSVFTSLVTDFCHSASNDFATIQGEDVGSGALRFKTSPLGFEALAVKTGAPGNPDGKTTHVRIFLPAPLNWRQAEEQLDRYEPWVLAAFLGISRYDLPLLGLPPYVRRTDSQNTHEQDFRYYHRAINGDDPPSELALISREVSGPGAYEVGKSSYKIELWVFTKRSGALGAND